AALVIGFFTLAPFKLPHYGLPAFPALALLAARAWDETMSAVPGALRPRALLLPILVVFAGVALTMAAAGADMLPISRHALSAVDVTTRNLEARGQAPTATPTSAFAHAIRASTGVFLVGTMALGFAFRRRAAGAGVAVVLATVFAFLPLAGN